MEMNKNLKKANNEYTFNDYLNKIFFLLPDFKTYEYNDTGKIVDTNRDISEETLKQINNHIRNIFFDEVERQFLEIKQKFETYLENYYDREYLITAELNTVEQILRSQKNSIIDTFGITHVIIRYINNDPVIFNGFELLKLSPAFNIDRETISDIRKYLVYEYKKQNSDFYFIQNIAYENKAKSYIMAEVFIKYHEFLRKSPKQTNLIGLKSNLEPHQVEILYNQLIDNYIIDKHTNPNHFKAIFKDEPLPKDFIKIKWLAEPILLSYFIFTLTDKKKIVKHKHWAITAYCFEPKCNLRQLADGFRNSKTGEPKRADEIDQVLNLL